MAFAVFACYRALVSCRGSCLSVPLLAILQSQGWHKGFKMSKAMLIIGKLKVALWEWPPRRCHNHASTSNHVYIVQLDKVVYRCDYAYIVLNILTVYAPVSSDPPRTKELSPLCGSGDFVSSIQRFYSSSLPNRLICPKAGSNKFRRFQAKHGPEEQPPQKKQGTNDQMQEPKKNNTKNIF